MILPALKVILLIDEAIYPMHEVVSLNDEVPDVMH
jgi:hypothetical protein